MTECWGSAPDPRCLPSAGGYFPKPQRCFIDYAFNNISAVLKTIRFVFGLTKGPHIFSNIPVYDLF